jgi:Flp pilus assembly protein TadG
MNRTIARRRNDERGATMVEGAIAAPIFFFVIFIVFQCAFVARAIVSAHYGVASGARAGAIAANDPLADHDILDAIAKSAMGLGKSSVTKVVVYKATSPADPVPSACLDHPVKGICNVYANADLSRPASDFTSTWAGATYWPASSRRVSRNIGTEYVGVYVQCDAAPVSGTFFPESLARTAVARLEGVTA